MINMMDQSHGIKHLLWTIRAGDNPWSPGRREWLVDDLGPAVKERAPREKCPGISGMTDEGWKGRTMLLQD